MAAHSYSLRSRLNGQSPLIRTQTGSPVTKGGIRSPQKANTSGLSLQLQQVIGTTTNSPTGLACCTLTNTYAYCAGAVAVLATVHPDGTTSKRYFKARPTAASLNPSSSFYESSSPSATPSRRRTSIFARRRPQDIDFSSAQDDRSSQTWTARERIKTVTCVGLSENGKWLAVGESGYNPRVLLFSTAEDALLDTPVSVVSDHTFGLSCVAFSPDSRFLATLGNLNDGFLFIWAISAKTGSLNLHSTNKCTTNICSMTWCGQSLITVGTRHVKIWSVNQPNKCTSSRRFSIRTTTEVVPSPGPATLFGRNALLGSLVDCTFTSVCTVDERLVLLGSDGGHLCGIEVSDGSAEVNVLKIFDFSISSISWQAVSRKVVIGGRSSVCYEDYSTLITTSQAGGVCSPSRPQSPRKATRSSSIRQSLGFPQPKSAGVCAIACLAQRLIALDTDGNLHNKDPENDDPESTMSSACRSDLIQGVKKLPQDCDLGAFYTWSRCGEVRFWDTGGKLLDSKLIALDQQDHYGDTDQNELRVIQCLSQTRQIVSGDRFGILKLIMLQDWTCCWTGRAHSAELTDMAVHESSSLVVTSGRDRMIQLFKVGGDALDLVQTMDDHIGAVTQVLFTPDASKLLSCAADRTVGIRERASRQVDGDELLAYLSLRVITLRSTPLSLALLDSTSTNILVSTSDRHVVNADLMTGAIVESLKITDPETGDTAALSSICVSVKGSSAEETCNLMAAVSATDKSIRIYDADKCQLLARESGHTEGVSDLCLIEREAPGTERKERVLISTGLDGTIMLWHVNLSSPALFTPVQELSQAQAVQGYTPIKPSPAALPPLRKLLSKIDAIEFSKSTESSSPSSPRALSPPRLARKRSNLALSAAINEEDENQHVDTVTDAKGILNPCPQERIRSPSPPPTPLGKLRKQRSRTEISSEALTRRSPSPPPLSVSTPSTPGRRTLANNSKLRRPPSVPSDLRGQSLAHSRSKSMGQANEFGSMGMATEQACRMLRTYRKKLMASKEDLSLDELQGELELITKLVRERKDRPNRIRTPDGRRLKAKAATENDLDELAVLLDRTSMAHKSSRPGVEVKT